jgi:hypothetical protein
MGEISYQKGSFQSTSYFTYDYSEKLKDFSEEEIEKDPEGVWDKIAFIDKQKESRLSDAWLKAFENTFEDDIGDWDFQATAYGSRNVKDAASLREALKNVEIEVEITFHLVLSSKLKIQFDKFMEDFFEKHLD